MQALMQSIESRHGMPRRAARTSGVIGERGKEGKDASVAARFWSSYRGKPDFRIFLIGILALHRRMLVGRA